MYTFVRKWEMAEGNPEEWTLEEEAYTHYLARLYAEEYTEDFCTWKAALRLGATQKAAWKLGAAVHDHPLTQHYIAEIIKTFEVRHNVTRDKILALLYRDATNYNALAKPAARVSAQKKLADILGMVENKTIVDLRSKQPIINMTVSPGE